jgi:hypothetical protein
MSVDEEFGESEEQPIESEQGEDLPDDSYDPEAYSSSSSQVSLSPSDSDAIPDSDEAIDEMENPHGFVFSHQLDTYKRSKKERT